MRSRDEEQRFILGLTLQVSVPLEIAKMRSWTHEARQRHAQGAADVIATHGDDLQFGGRHCTEAFAALTRGLAVLAYQPGGVDFAGLHFCTAPHAGCPRHLAAAPPTAG
jgi:hypothetical protein